MLGIYLKETTRNSRHSAMQFPKRALKEGSIMAITVTTPDGEKIETNLRIKAEDLELLKELTN